jgi:hypothetical protein
MPDDDFCAQLYQTWDAGYGLCDTYDPIDGYNNYYCGSPDVADIIQGLVWNDPNVPNYGWLVNVSPELGAVDFYCGCQAYQVCQAECGIVASPHSYEFTGNDVVSYADGTCVNADSDGGTYCGGLSLADLDNPCSCQDICEGYGNCCGDYQAVCVDVEEVQVSSVEPTCDGFCGGNNDGAGCACGDLCAFGITSHSDYECCPDYSDVCSSSSTSFFSWF